MLASHAAVVLNSLSALPDNSDETIGAASDAAYMAARYRVSRGYYAAASLREIAERLVISTGKKGPAPVSGHRLADAPRPR
jgi:hypothetical protein